MSESAGGAQLLVSFCNRAGDPQPSGLLHVDLVGLQMQWVDVGLSVASGAGICSDDRYVYHLSIANSDLSTNLTVLDRHTLQVLSVQRLSEADDGHSLARLGDEIYVASTGTDEILAYRMDGAEATDGRVAWSPTDAGTDTHHINSVAVAGGEIVCSAFGPKEGASWITATNGYIRSLTSGAILASKLAQPHTVSWHDAELYFCNSQMSSVNTAEEVVAYLSGYSRGLAFMADGTIYAGESVGRRPMNDPTPVDAPGEMLGRCAVVQLPRSGTRTVIGLSSFGSEIYDLLAL